MEMRATLSLLVLMAPAFCYAGAPKPIMIEPGETIVSWEYDSEKDADKKWLKLRKETVCEVEEGALNVMPPSLIEKEKKTKWGDSTFARIGLVGLPLDYVCQARWKYIRPEDAKARVNGLVYIDLGHRMIRATFSREGTVLLLENHLIGRDSGKPAIVLDEAPGFKLEDGKWYDIIAEVKGDEVVIQIGDQVLYGKHELIASDQRYDTFNFDATGDGFLIDRWEVKAAGKFQASWKAKRKTLQ